MIRVLRLEIRRSIVGFGAPLIVFVGVLFVFAKLSPAATVWPDTNTQLNVSIIFLGPIVGGVATLAGQREARRRTAYLRRLSARATPTPALMELTAAICWVFVSFALMTACVFIWTGIRATGGRPIGSWTLATFVGLLLFVPIGFVVGRLTRLRIAPPLVAIIGYLLLAYDEGVYGRGWGPSLSPIIPTAGDIFQRFNNALTYGQTVWLLGLSVLIVAMWCLGMVVRDPAARPPAWSALCAVAAVVTIVGINLVAGQGNNVYVGAAQLSYVCDGTDPKVCLVTEYRNGLSALLPAMTLLDDRLAGTSAQFDSARQVEPGRERPLGHPDVDISIDAVYAGYAAITVQELVANTYAPPCDAGNGTGTIAQQLQYLVQTWLQSPPGASLTYADFPQPGTAAVNTATRWFAAKPEVGRRVWLRRHYPGLAHCTLTAADFR